MRVTDRETLGVLFFACGTRSGGFEATVRIVFFRAVKTPGICVCKRSSRGKKPPATSRPFLFPASFPLRARIQSAPSRRNAAQQHDAPSFFCIPRRPLTEFHVQFFLVWCVLRYFWCVFKIIFFVGFVVLFRVFRFSYFPIFLFSYFLIFIFRI